MLMMRRIKMSSREKLGIQLYLKAKFLAIILYMMIIKKKHFKNKNLI